MTNLELNFQVIWHSQKTLSIFIKNKKIINKQKRIFQIPINSIKISETLWKLNHVNKMSI